MMYDVEENVREGAILFGCGRILGKRGKFGLVFVGDGAMQSERGSGQGLGLRAGIRIVGDLLQLGLFRVGRRVVEINKYDGNHLLRGTGKHFGTADDHHQQQQKNKKKKKKQDTTKKEKTGTVSN